MRGFTISVILFSIMLITICINSYFIAFTVNDMSKTAESLNKIPCKSNQAIIDELESEWRAKSVWIGLSVSNDDMQKLTDAIEGAKIANKNEDITQFQIYLALLNNSLYEISRLEKFSIKNIL